MTVAITVEHNEARLAGTLAFLDAGSNPARLRIYGGTRPATPATTPASAMLVEIRLTKPAGTISGGLLTLTQQEDGLITSTGVATWARLVMAADPLKASVAAVPRRWELEPIRRPREMAGAPGRLPGAVGRYRLALRRENDRRRTTP